MPYVFVPGMNLAKVAVEGLWGSQKVVQTFWFAKDTGEPSQSDLEDLCHHMIDNWNASMRTAQGAEYYLTRVTATRQNSANDIQAQVIPTAPIQGTGSGGSVTLGANWVFTYRTALRGRNYRGRGYQPGLIKSILSGVGEGNLATLAGLATNYVNWLITNMVTDFTWVVASHFLNHLPRSIATLSPITAVSVDNKLDSQRRRLLGRGQ